MSATIVARGVHKRFGAVRALDGLDLAAHPGRITALLGPNGSGKTTFVRAVSTLTTPDVGTLTVAGIDVTRQPAAVRRLVGLAGQAASVDGALTGRENLHMIARLFGHHRRAATSAADHVINMFELGEVADRLVRTYSGGMRRRLDLGVSLVGAPRLLLLDEPTTGLDPRSRNALWTYITELPGSGTDVLLTTQYLEEADRLADDVVILDRGRTVATGTPEELKRRVGAEVVQVTVQGSAGGALDRFVAAMSQFTLETPQFDRDSGRTSFAVSNGTQALRETIRVADHLELELGDVAVRRPTLDEAFIALTGHSSSDDGPPASVPAADQDA